MSAVALETNFLCASELPSNNRPGPDVAGFWIDYLCQAFFQEDERQPRVVAYWNSPYTVVFQPRRSKAGWHRKIFELQSKIVARYQTMEFAQPIDQREADSKLFESLTAQWHDERREVSWTVDIAMCPSYQKIIAMGKERAVPLILARLAEEGEEPDHWFWALRILTGANPVPHEHQGAVVEMASDWIEWGKTQEWIW